MSFASKPRAQKHMEKLSPLVIPERTSFTSGCVHKLRSAVGSSAETSPWSDKPRSGSSTKSPSSFADKLREAVTMARHETQRMDGIQTDLHKFVDE